MSKSNSERGIQRIRRVLPTVEKCLAWNGDHWAMREWAEIMKGDTHWMPMPDPPIQPTVKEEYQEWYSSMENIIDWDEADGAGAKAEVAWIAAHKKYSTKTK